LEKYLSEGSIPIILTRRPEINEEEVGKLKKSKPKTLNVG
jgi:hypothetical protein